MIVGNPKLKVTRTDVARYINDNSEKFPELIPFWEKYLEKCNRARKIKVSQFGFWIRSNKPQLFQRIYKRVSKDMSILEDIYANTDSC